MTTSPNAIVAFFLRRETILAVFVVAILISGLFGELKAGTENGWLTGILPVAIAATLAFFTYKRQLLATWATILVLIITGSGYLHDSFTGLTSDAEGDFFSLAVKALAGIYLTWGALIIHRERHLPL